MKDSLKFDKVMQLWLCALDLLLSSSNKMCRVLAALSVVQKFCRSIANLAEGVRFY